MSLPAPGVPEIALSPSPPPFDPALSLTMPPSPKRLKDRISDRIDVLPPVHSVARPSTSSPNVVTPETNSDPTAARSVDSQSENNVFSINYNTKNPPNQLSTRSPTRQLSRNSSEVASPSPRTGTSGSKWAQEQPTFSHASAAAPSSAALSAGSNSWVSPRVLLGLLDQGAGAFGPLQAVAGEFIACIKAYERAASGRKEFMTLQKELEGLFEDLQRQFAQDAPLVFTASIENLCKSILRELDYVKEKQGGTTIGRSLKKWEDSGEVLACYRRIHGYLKRLSLNLNLSMWEIVDEQTADARLTRLCSSLSACYNSAEAAGLKRGACTPGTRIDVLAQMHGWVDNKSTGLVYWLNGMAGTGKTTIAYSLCAELEATHKLGASFFCSRALPDCRDVNRIIPSIAYQLSIYSRPFRCVLLQALEKERDVHTRQLRIQFENLIVKTLVAVRDTLPGGLVVVIDALDECDNQQSTGRILDALFTKAQDLPIKFFVSSRPEPEIRDQMKKQGGHKKSARLVLHELDKGMVQGDIETYLREALAPIHPTEAQIATLVERAGILFIYAATVVRYIGSENFRQNPHARLETILSVSTASGNNPYRDIDDLYTVTLKAAINDPNLSDIEREDIKQVLYTAICARGQLTIGTLSGLLGLGNIERVLAALRPLWSVLHVVQTSGLVATLHASFPDYMFDPERSKEYYCDMAAHNHTLTRCCFDAIRCAKPHFNICGLESSYVLDEKIPNLKEKVRQSISSSLYYACRYWASHLEHVKGPSEAPEHLERFLSTGLLLWMEVMNINKHMHDGVEMMQLAESWCVRQRCSQELTQLVHEGWRFVAAFTSSSVSQSTPHLYVSMLPFWPESSPLSKHYAKHMKVPMVPQGPARARRRLEHLAAWPVDGEVSGYAWLSDGAQIALVAGGKIFILDALTGGTVIGPLQQKSSSNRSVGCSYDGARIVSGSIDGTIRVWDAHSGKKMFGPLRGHTDVVTSVAFSPDGTRIASTSQDKTIRVWDGRTGKKLVGPLKEHSNWVTSVVFSPDGTRIVSGSYDNTIRVWDVQRGRTLLGPLEGHTNAVTSVAFSSDGARIVSGSGDSTIRVWDIQSGKTVLGPLQGHANSVTSVAFSPDSTRIVSGSDDNTIRVWDIQGGKMMLGPLEGHTNSVTSVGFSPDGTRIVSGSYDKTICVWDIQGRKTVLGSLQRHTHWVTSVGFSPDGTRIVSGSYDNTIRVWDIQGGNMVLDPLEGHTSWVTSVGFSPDGARIVSGSYDKTIRVWDIQGERTVLGPLEGHTGWVTSVVFSPDGTRIVSGSYDNTIRVWDAQSGRTMFGPLEGHKNSVTSVACSSDGTRIVSGSGDNTIRVWDIQDGDTVLGPFEGHTNPVTSVAFSPDGTRIVSGSDDNTIRVWNTQGGNIVLDPLEGHTNSVTSVAFSSDGTRIVSGSDDNTIRVWDIQEGRTVLGPLQGHTSWVSSVGFSPDGAHIVSGSYDKTIRVWDIQGRTTVLGSLQGHTHWIMSVGFSPDGTQIVSGSYDNTIRVWDIQGGKMVLGPLEEHTGWVTSVAFSPNGTRIVSGSGDNTIRVWDIQGGKTVLGPLQRHTGWVTSVVFSPDGTRIISGSSDNTIRVWDSQSGRAVLGPLEGHTNLVTSVAFSPDSTRIVSGSYDRTIRVWDIKGGKMILGPLKGHTGWVMSVAFSPNGTCIVSGSEDKTIRVWDTQSGKTVIGPLEVHTELVTSVAFFPDGTRIVSGSDDKTICVWDIQSGRTMLGPLEGHTDSVRSVAFSPDGTRIVSGSCDNTIRVWDIQSMPKMVQHFTPISHDPIPWDINTDGWVVDRSRLLVWVPPDLRHILQRPRNTLLISSEGYVHLSLKDAHIGESWVKCYQS